MGEHKIKVTISPLGLPKIEAVGYNGMGCTEATAPLERALQSGNGQTTVREFKAEAYNPEETEQNTISW